MIAEKLETIHKPNIIAARLSDYAQLIKMRLSTLVVFSAAMGFLFATGSNFNWNTLLWLIAGGFLVTGSSNAFNQVIEKDLDKLMTRTANRPLPAGRMSVAEATIVAMIMGISGIFILYKFMNPLSGLLGSAALILYTLAYTPLKRITPFSVFVGAIPGAIPPLLGWVAAKGFIGMDAVMLYALQFIWQFPHFWSIAWMLDDDYKKAGFKMMPTKEGRGKRTAFQTIVYTVTLIPMAMLTYSLHISGMLVACIVALSGVFFTLQTVDLYLTCSMKSASRLMFGSIIYLPVVQIAMTLEKFF